MGNNIILIGFMGSGKSSIGRYLSKLLKFNLIETDCLIERYFNLSISEIFRIYGEIFFRKQENKLLNEIKNRKNSIIATGGGMPIFFNNSSILKSLGNIFYLEISFNTFTKRTKNDKTRPLRDKHKLFYIRKPFYEKIADFKINCDFKSIEHSALIIKEIYENSCR